MAAVGMIAATSAAYASDVSVNDNYAVVPITSPDNDWTGAFGGVQVGYDWTKFDATVTGPGGGSGSLGVAGFSLGGRIGYNQQFGHLVVGVIGDYNKSWANAQGVSTPWNASVIGRIGTTWDQNRSLFYVGGGVAFGNISGTSGGLTVSETRTGWKAVVGIERAFTPKLSGFLEASYTDLGTRSYSFPPNAATLKDTGIGMKIGAVYHFGGG